MTDRSSTNLNCASIGRSHRSRVRPQKSSFAFRTPTNATKKLIDSSACKSLIYMGVTGVPSGLRPPLGGEGRRENMQTESKPRRLLAEMALSAVRKNPQEPAQTRGSRQKKANRLGLAFKVLVGWGHLKEALQSS